MQPSGRNGGYAVPVFAKDDSLAEAHSALGWSLLFYDFGFLAAEQQFLRAIELDQQNAVAIERYASCLGMMGRHEESVREVLRAVRLDPLSPIIATVAGMLLYLARNYDRSIEMCRRALELDANFYNARWTIAAALSKKGLHHEAIEEIEPVVRATNRLPLHLFLLGTCYANAGRCEDACRVLDELRDASQRRFVPAYWSAVIHAEMHNKDEAFRFLETAYIEQEPWMAMTIAHPWMDNLRSDPRYDVLLGRLKFPA